MLRHRHCTDQRTTAISETVRPVSPSDPAELFRSRAEWPDEIDRAEREKIGDGPLAKMLRLALTDPDQELWRYSISVAGQLVTGNAIGRLSVK